MGPTGARSLVLDQESREWMRDATNHANGLRTAERWTAHASAKQEGGNCNGAEHRERAGPSSRCIVAYDFHPEVRHDLDEIWDFIAADSPTAADRVLAKIVAVIDRLVSFPKNRPQTPGPHITPFAVCSRA